MLIILRGIHYDCSLKMHHYKNGRMRLDLIDNEDGLQIATCTTNITEQECEIGHCWIKDYEENNGLLEQLVKNRIISLPLSVLSGMYGEHSYYCKFLNNPNSQL